MGKQTTYVVVAVVALLASGFLGYAAATATQDRGSEAERLEQKNETIRELRERLDNQEENRKQQNTIIQEQNETIRELRQTLETRQEDIRVLTSRLNNSTGGELASTRRELEITKERLAQTRERLNTTEQELADKKTDLRETERELENCRNEQ